MLQVLHHPLNDHEIASNPLGDTALCNARRIVEGRKDGGLDRREPLGLGNLSQLRREDPVEAPPQVELVVAVDGRQGP